MLVLDKGRSIYFGPTKEAKAYFMSLGFECENRKSTPDFLTGITNPQERKIRNGVDESTVPLNSVDLEAAYKQSEHYQRAMKELEEYERQLKEEVCFITLIFTLRIHTNYISRALWPISRKRFKSRKPREQARSPSTQPVFGSKCLPSLFAKPLCGGETSLVSSQDTFLSLFKDWFMVLFSTKCPSLQLVDFFVVLLFSLLFCSMLSYVTVLFEEKSKSINSLYSFHKENFSVHSMVDVLSRSKSHMQCIILLPITLLK